MNSLNTLFQTWNKEFFQGKLSNVPLRLYSRRSKTHGFYRFFRNVQMTGIIHINTFNTSEKDMQYCLLHECVHAYLHALGMPHGHSPYFKSLLKSLTEKAFGFRPVGNVRFLVNVQNAALAIPVATIAPSPVTIAPVLTGTRFKVITTGEIGTLVRTSTIYGTQHVTLQLPSKMFPFTIPTASVVCIP